MVIELRAEPVCGDDCALASHLCQSKDIFENRHKQVHLGDRSELQGVVREFSEALQDQF